MGNSCIYPALVQFDFLSAAKASTISSSSHDRSTTASSIKVLSSLLKRKTGSRNSTVSDSTSTSDAAVRYLSKSKGLRNCRLSTQSLSLSNNFSSVSPAGSSFGMSSSGPGSRTKQKSNDTEVHFDTPVTLTRTNTQDEVNPSPHLTNNLHRKFTACLLNKQTNSLVLQSKQGSADASHVPTESRKKLKPSYLRMPSPKIGFFDEVLSVSPANFYEHIDLLTLNKNSLV